jgi:hypothetical protein
MCERDMFVCEGHVSMISAGAHDRGRCVHETNNQVCEPGRSMCACKGHVRTRARSARRNNRMEVGAIEVFKRGERGTCVVFEVVQGHTRYIWVRAGATQTDQVSYEVQEKIRCTGVNRHMHDGPHTRTHTRLHTRTRHTHIHLHS